MPKKDELKIWEVLTKAKKYLTHKRVDCYSDMKYTYICHCISIVYGTDPYKEEIRKTPAHKLIAKRLGGFESIEDWLAENAPWYYDSCSDNKLNIYDQVQEYRHRWLDALIKECKEKNL